MIGTLAAREPGPIEVATGDRDLFQVIDDKRGVTVLFCGKGVANLEVFDDAAVREKYGVAAAGYADLAALRGDPSDGLPGVPGVGEKTAARIVDRYGSLDAILVALADPAAGIRAGPADEVAGGGGLSGRGAGGGPGGQRCAGAGCPTRLAPAYLATRSGCWSWPTGRGVANAARRLVDAPPPPAESPGPATRRPCAKAEAGVSGAG